MKMYRSAAALLAVLLLLFSGCRQKSAGDGAHSPAGEEITNYGAVPGKDPEAVPSPDPDHAESAPNSDTAAPVETNEPSDSSFVRVADYIDGIYVELRYSGENNFVGEAIYDFTDAWLRYGTVKKLQTAVDELIEAGYSIRIWDAFRPVSAQFKLWEKVPDPRYVANPNSGYSSHSSGSAVDITLVSLEGKDLEMPTDFDDFSKLADRDYSDVSETAAKNARLLEDLMTRAGFTPYSAEWWHFSDTAYYEPEKTFQPPSDPIAK